MVVYHGVKYYKAKAEKAKSKGKAKRKSSKSKASENTSQKAKGVPDHLKYPDGRVNLNKFETRLPGNQGYKGPKGWKILRDRAGNNGHGGSFWKLINKAGERIATLSRDGRILRK